MSWEATGWCVLVVIFAILVLAFWWWPPPATPAPAPAPATPAAQPDPDVSEPLEPCDFGHVSAGGGGADPQHPPLLTPADAAEVHKYFTCRETFGKSGRYETACRAYIEARFGRKFPNCRPLFLRNPETGRNLELDCYNEDLRLAVEYQGPQHYGKDIGRGLTNSDLLAIQRRDRFKVAICERLGVDLIVVPPWVRYDDLGNYIEERLPLRLKASVG